MRALRRTLSCRAHPARQAGRATQTLVLATSALALTAACGDSDETGGDLPTVEGPTSPRLEVIATEMAYQPDEIAVEAGEVEVVLHNDGRVLHDIRIGEEPFIIEAGADQTATDSLTLEEGRYEFFCSLPGHREAGMDGIVEVRAP